MKYLCRTINVHVWIQYIPSIYIGKSLRADDQTNMLCVQTTIIITQQ